jgi:hypothetical protein
MAERRPNRGSLRHGPEVAKVWGCLAGVALSLREDTWMYVRSDAARLYDVEIHGSSVTSFPRNRRNPAKNGAIPQPDPTSWSGGFIHALSEWVELSVL